MGRNLSNLFISQSYQFITQISGSELQDGLGNTITGSLAITSSQAISSSFATTASFALNAGTTVSTASLLTTASAVNNVITFTKGDGSTFPVTVATGSGGGSVNTGSLLITASISNATTTFTKGDGSTFSITANNVVNADSASLAANATSASFATTAISASFATNSNTATSSSFATSASQAQNAISASFATTSNTTTSSSFASTASLALNNVLTASSNNDTITFTKGDGTTFTNVINNVSASISSSFATTASFASTIANGLSPTFANVTASNVLITGTASVNVLITNFVSSSIIYSSGSNQFGDASDDVQTLYGTVDIKTGPVLITGSVTSTTGFTGSLLGTASYATQALSASYALNATSASYIPNAITTASVSSNTITFTKGDGTTFPITVNTGSAGSAFPYTGSAIISGSLTVTGSLNVSGSVTGNVLGNNTDTYTTSAPVQQVVTLTQAEYNAIGSPDANTLYIISGSTPINVSEFVTTSSFNAFTSSVVTTSSFNAFTSSVVTTSSFNAFTGSVATTGSNTFTGNQTINASASADYWLVDTKPFAKLDTNTIIAGRIDGADEDFVLAGRNYAGGTANAITMTDGEFIYNEAAHIFTGSVNLSSTLNVTGVTTLKDDVIITGSLRGNVNALSISSQTSSLDCSTGNFFTLLLVSGSTTFVNPSNILPGQTINLRIKQASVASGSISFASSVKQVSGSAYTPTATANGEDIVTFISFDSTNLYLSNIKNFV